MKRVFMAILFREKATLHLENLQERLKPYLQKGKFVSPSLCHLTLQFIGEIEAEAVEVLVNHSFPWLANQKPFRFSLKGVGAFQKRNQWILWAGLEENSALIDLTEKVRVSLAALGYRDQQPFVPHVTLARGATFKGEEGFGRFLAVSFGPHAQLCDGFYLMESVRIEGTLLYRPLKKYAFST